MRIGFDAKRAFFNSTGLGNYSRDIIHILSKYHTRNDYFMYTPKLKKSNSLDFLDKYSNIHVKTPSLFYSIASSYWRSKGVIKDLIKDGINIYHGLSNEIPIGIEKTNIKSVVTIHDLIFIRFPELFNQIDKYIYYRKFKSSCERADVIIAISKQTKNDIIKFFNIEDEKIKVIYQGCNKIFHNPINDKEQIRKKYKLSNSFLLHIGRIEERKNLLTILKVMREIPEKQLVVVGNGKKYKKKCIDFIKKYNLTNRVIILSDLDITEIAAIYQLAEIMIYPSLFEGFGIPILESLFSKTPVITSKEGCFKEAGGPDSIYVNPLSVAEIKKAIISIQTDKELCVRMKENGYIYAQKFTDNRIANELVNMYQNL